MDKNDGVTLVLGHGHDGAFMLFVSGTEGDPDYCVLGTVLDLDGLLTVRKWMDGAILELTPTTTVT